MSAMKEMFRDVVQAAMEVDCGIFINFVIGNTNLLVQIRYTKTLKTSHLYLRASNFSKCIENKQVKGFTICTL